MTSRFVTRNKSRRSAESVVIPADCLVQTVCSSGCDVMFVCGPEQDLPLCSQPTCRGDEWPY